MDILNKFEQLADKPIFSSNKQCIFQLVRLNLNNNNQAIRTALSNKLEHFADMTRVAK